MSTVRISNLHIFLLAASFCGFAVAAEAPLLVFLLRIVLPIIKFVVSLWKLLGLMPGWGNSHVRRANFSSAAPSASVAHNLRYKKEEERELEMEYSAAYNLSAARIVWPKT